MSWVNLITSRWTSHRENSHAIELPLAATAARSNVLLTDRISCNATILSSSARRKQMILEYIR